jgi:hypothetical protein
MIDRISRNFVSYGDYRQSMSSRVAISTSRLTRSKDVIDSNGRFEFLAASPYPRTALEVSLVRGHREAERIALYYNPSGYLDPSLNVSVLRGQNIDRYA